MSKVANFAGSHGDNLNDGVLASKKTGISGPFVFSINIAMKI